MRARDLLLAQPGGYRRLRRDPAAGLRFALAGPGRGARRVPFSLPGGSPSRVCASCCLNLTHALPDPAVVPELLALPLPPADLGRYDALCAVAR